MKVKSKPILISVLMIAFITGFLLPVEKLYAFDGEDHWCWSADNVSPGGGYYRCKPTLSCYWVDDRLPEGEADGCRKIIEDETVN